ncbi:PDR/VanB family oxidoreductase [Paraburkholderia phenoliruptrix]|nr:PDR/VanB family oxidoreductase [Paraburkholderia phenoliruptrix]CAB4048589.1 Phenoxybenzoate dioxygenase subunit beta [Paraburkholderia phenoliruptrix]
MKVLIASKTIVATDIVSFELVSTVDEDLPAFSAGAHIDVTPVKGVTRQYSLVNNPSETNRYCIAVLLEPKSRGGSSAMHALSAGEFLEIGEPRNHFPLDWTANHSILLAGGIGITPILSMAEQLSQAGASFELHYCVRDEARAAFRQRLDKSDLSRNWKLYTDTGPSASRISFDEVFGSPADDKHVYVCGPGGFIEAALNSATQLGWRDANQHREFFGAASSPNADGAAFTIELAKSGRRIEVAANETAFAALSRVGVKVPISCEQGVCGTCLTRVIAGRPDHRDLYLTDAEKATDDQFLPCCSRSLSPILVLDL